ncbi:MAG TPA: hypothetical protein VLJ14_19100 [Ktedonobacterales bacterium]|nr:hypothetical protein [Ktedonobacterales bacterium]
MGAARTARPGGQAPLPADAAASNADLADTYPRLIPARFRRHNNDWRVTGRRYSMAFFVVYFGTDRRYEQVGHHEILMGQH